MNTIVIESTPLPNPRINDLRGLFFQRLLITSFSHTANGRSWWHARCLCGNVIVTTGNRLIKGDTKSCGCLISPLTKKWRHTAHVGRRRTPLYSQWGNMNDRLYNPSCKTFPHYGGKGITGLPEWRYDFDAYADWALANGYREGLTIDRIDPKKGYFPGNIQYVTNSENSRRANAYHKARGTGVYAARK